jgi:CheY-like chemotaxis protein
MVNELPRQALKALPSLADEKRLLLLDANGMSREKRAVALQDRGANVDSVASAKLAQNLWRPGSHEVVLIDFRNAGEEMYDFYRDARLRSAKQKFGFYVSGPPYLAKSYRQYEAAGARDWPAVDVVAAPAEADGQSEKCLSGFCEAARQIATVRRLTFQGSSGNALRRGIPVIDAIRFASRVPGAEQPGAEQ